MLLVSNAIFVRSMNHTKIITVIYLQTVILKSKMADIEALKIKISRRWISALYLMSVICNLLNDNQQH